MKHVGSVLRECLVPTFVCLCPSDRYSWRLLGGTAAHIHNCIAVMSPPSQHVYYTRYSQQQLNEFIAFVSIPCTRVYRCANLFVPSTSVCSHLFITIFVVVAAVVAARSTNSFHLCRAFETEARLLSINLCVYVCVRGVQMNSCLWSSDAELAWGNEK